MKLIVHIPKTAGTSFRRALEKYHGKTQVVRDYGLDEEATTDIVGEYLYCRGAKRTPEALFGAISSNAAEILVGHFRLKKYARFFQPEDVITFVRDPLVRTCSEYLHRRRNKTFDGSFGDFVCKPNMQNFQSQFLEGISEKSIIGLTERYDESLLFINEYFQWNLKVLKKNVARREGGRKFAANLSKHDLDLFYRLNNSDLNLYRSVNQRFSNLDVPMLNKQSIFEWLTNKSS